MLGLGAIAMALGARMLGFACALLQFSWGGEGLS